jgi:hypothetical protein
VETAERVRADLFIDFIGLAIRFAHIVGEIKKVNRVDEVASGNEVYFGFEKFDLHRSSPFQSADEVSGRGFTGIVRNLWFQLSARPAHFDGENIPEVCEIVNDKNAWLEDLLCFNAC